MGKCNLRVQRNPLYPDETYDLRVWDGQEFHSLGLRKIDELLFALQRMTFLDGSTPEQIWDIAHKSGSANAEIEWPEA